MSNNEGLISDLASIIGKESVSDNIFDRINYGQDAFGLDLERSKVPIAVVRPRSAQEVSQVLEYANTHRIPIYIRGAGASVQSH